MSVKASKSDMTIAKMRAYYDMERIKDVASFIGQAPGKYQNRGQYCKTFLSVIYGFSY